MTNRIRCAIYTRKSSEDGLDQEFNSLDAQREACEAFIKSQRGLGWVALSTFYDDGGLSGGSMARPALQNLLTDIDAGKIDLVVVYKVDRLTRSLADFAKIVDVFDARSVSFVSVTQQFNTATSMGRLTLNMLLSFAQFEREVTAERIRDKIAASKQKGMWMGGIPPLGYDLVDKKLVVNKAEAGVVRSLYLLYLELGNVRALKDAANQQRFVTKRRQFGDDHFGGKPFTRGHLYQILHNPIYAGQISHKGKIYEGQHEGIVDRKTWEAVQRTLTANASNRTTTKNVKGDYLLADLLVDQSGNRLIPHHSTKKGRRYRYYVSKNIAHPGKSGKEHWRLPAVELDRIVTDQIGAFLQDQTRVLKALKLSKSPAQTHKFLKATSDLHARLIDESNLERYSLVRSLVGRIVLKPDSISIGISKNGIHNLTFESADIPSTDGDDTIHIDIPIELRRRGVEAKLLITNGGSRNPEESLIVLLSRSHRWLRELTKSDACTVRQIAERENLDEADVSRFLPLAFLAPDIVTAIVDGTQPPELTVASLRRACPIPNSWTEQRRRLGFQR